MNAVRVGLRIDVGVGVGVETEVGIGVAVEDRMDFRLVGVLGAIQGSVVECIFVLRVLVLVRTDSRDKGWIS